MKVFAQYFEEEGLQFRKNTILQFGNSWNLIGSVVLINPGSASPTNEVIGHEEMKFLKLYEGSKQSDWYVFNADATMRQIEKIFNGSYVNEESNLNGVIQLFNLFNLRDPNLRLALQKVQQSTSPHLFSVEITGLFKNKPVYIGWGWNSIITDIRLEQAARMIFNNVDFKLNPIYDPKFENNSFWHPRYLNMHYNKPKEQELLNAFYNLL